MTFPTDASPLLGARTWAGEPLDDSAPPTTGTVFSSAINLSACAFGASMLSLPFAMAISGPIIALEFLALFGIMSFFASQAVLVAGRSANKSSYAAIVRHYFGPVQGSIADALLAVALLVAAISYIVGLADLFPDILSFMSAINRTFRIVLTVIVLYPITLVSTLASFGPASTIASLGCYVLAIALVLQVITTTTPPQWTSPSWNIWTQVNPSALIYSFPMICFVYAYHYVLTDTISELHTPTTARTSKVNLLTIIILFWCYLPVAISGYLLKSGTDISSNVLAGMSATAASVIIAQWTIAALLFVTYSLFIIPLRRKIELSIFGNLTERMTDPKRLAIAAGLNLFVAIVSIALPDLGLANTLAGGCIALIMFFFPGRLMIRLQLDLPPTERSILQLIIGTIFTAFGALICVVGLCGSLIFGY